MRETARNFSDSGSGTKAAAIRIVAVEGLVPLLIIGIGWRQLWSRTRNH